MFWICKSISPTSHELSNIFTTDFHGVRLYDFLTVFFLGETSQQPSSIHICETLEGWIIIVKI